LYINNILIASKSNVQNVKIELNNEFEMKDLGVAKKILRIEITRQHDVKHLYLSQEIYLKILDKFGMTNLKPISTPLASHYKLSDHQSPKIVEERYFIC